MAPRTCRIGVHGRNAELFDERDFQIIREGRLEVIKMMSHTRPEVFARIKQENPDIEIITRLYDDRIHHDHPSPEDFCRKLIPVMQALRPHCQKFHVHNEPNHAAGYEGWGATAADAASFNRWFLQVYNGLKAACPWAKIGFPGLAVPDFLHHDKTWLRVCRPAIEKADFLGVHCYWQTPKSGDRFYLDENFGLAFRYYHQMYPHKPLEILECGNSNIQSNLPISEDAIAAEYEAWLAETFKYPYLNSAAFFILSSPDTTNWAFFSWRMEDGRVKPVVQRLARMQRPPRTAVKLEAAPNPETTSDVDETTSEPPPTNTGATTMPTDVATLQAELAEARQDNAALTERLQQLAKLWNQAREAQQLAQKVAKLEAQLKQAQDTLAHWQQGGDRVAVPPPIIHNITDKLPRHPRLRYRSRLLTDVKSVIIHHTAAPADVSAQKLATFSVHQSRWPGIGFHYLVQDDGTIEQCNPPSLVTFHAGPQNEVGVGIALAGEFDTGAPPDAQLAATAHLIAWLLGYFGLDLANVFGHREIADTSSPGAEWSTGANWRETLLTKARTYLEGNSA